VKGWTKRNPHQHNTTIDSTRCLAGSVGNTAHTTQHPMQNMLLHIAMGTSAPDDVDLSAAGQANTRCTRKPDLALMLLSMCLPPLLNLTQLLLLL